MKINDEIREIMVEIIEKNWEEMGWNENDMNRNESIYFLGLDRKEARYLSKEEIDEQVSDIKLAAILEGEVDDAEIEEKFNAIVEKGLTAPWDDKYYGILEDDIQEYEEER